MGVERNGSSTGYISTTEIPMAGVGTKPSIPYNISMKVEYMYVKVKVFHRQSSSLPSG